MSAAPDRRRATARLVVFLAAVAGGVAVLHGLGDILPSPPLGIGLWGFLQHTDPLVTSFAILRLVGLVLGWYLLSTTLLGLVARATRVAALVRAVDVVSLPSVRRLVRGAASVSLVVSLSTSGAATAVLLAARPAVADPAPTSPATPSTPSTVATPPIMRALDEPPATPPTVSSPVLGAPTQPPIMRALDEPPAASPTEPQPAGPTMRVLDDPPSPTTNPPTVDEPPAPPPSNGAPPPPSVPTTSSEAGDRHPSADPSVAPPTTEGSVPAGGEPSPSPAHPPSGESPSTADIPAPRATTWTIQPGDHLWHVSRSTLTAALGRAPSDAETVEYLHRVIDANQSVFVVAGQPDLVFPGQVFALPPPT